MANIEDYDSASDWLAPSRAAQREKQKKGSVAKTILLVAVGIAIIAGLGYFLWTFVIRRRKNGARHSNKPHDSPVNSPYHPGHQLPPPNPHVVNMGEPRKAEVVVEAHHHRGAAQLKALKLWTVDQLAYMQVLDSDSMSRLLVETIDQTSLELRPNHGRIQLLTMPGDGDACPCNHDKASLIIMVYQDNSSSCHAAAPLFSSAAKIVSDMHRQDPRLGLLKFGVIDYHDMPIYIANHVPKETPSFIIYDAKDDMVKVADISDLAMLAEQITAYYKLLNQ